MLPFAKRGDHFYHLLSSGGAFLGSMVCVWLFGGSILGPGNDCGGASTVVETFSPSAAGPPPRPKMWPAWPPSPGVKASRLNSVKRHSYVLEMTVRERWRHLFHNHLTAMRFHSSERLARLRVLDFGPHGHELVAPVLLHRMTTLT